MNARVDFFAYKNLLAVSLGYDFNLLRADKDIPIVSPMGTASESSRSNFNKHEVYLGLSAVLLGGRAWRAGSRSSFWSRRSPPAQRADATTMEVPPPVGDSSLGVGDTFEVRVFGEADLTGVYRVGGEGTITFPLAGQIKVEGLEPQTAAKRIAERLADGILRNPQVTVLVKEQTSKKLVVMGQVSKPGTYSYAPNMTIIELVSMAGGFTQISAKNDTTITRMENGKKVDHQGPGCRHQRRQSEERVRPARRHRLRAGAAVLAGSGGKIARARPLRACLGDGAGGRRGAPADAGRARRRRARVVRGGGFRPSCAREGLRITPPAWVALAAFAWTAIQLVPLPLSLLGALSPNAASLRAELGAGAAPITLDVAVDAARGS